MTYNEYKEIEKIRTAEYKEMLNKINTYFALFGSNKKNIEIYNKFWEFNEFIEHFEVKAIQSHGKQKENAVKHLETLYKMQQFNAKVFAKFNYENLVLNQKCLTLQKDQIKFTEKIQELEKQIEINEKLNNF